MSHAVIALADAMLSGVGGMFVAWKRHVRKLVMIIGEKTFRHHLHITYFGEPKACHMSKSKVEIQIMN
jgi:hypothetical protein